MSPHVCASSMSTLPGGPGHRRRQPPLGAKMEDTFGCRWPNRSWRPQHRDGGPQLAEFVDLHESDDARFSTSKQQRAKLGLVWFLPRINRPTGSRRPSTCSPSCTRRSTRCSCSLALEDADRLGGGHPPLGHRALGVDGRRHRVRLGRARTGPSAPAPTASAPAPRYSRYVVTPMTSASPKRGTCASAPAVLGAQVPLAVGARPREPPECRPLPPRHHGDGREGDGRRLQRLPRGDFRQLQADHRSSCWWRRASKCRTCSSSS